MRAHISAGGPERADSGSQSFAGKAATSGYTAVGAHWNFTLAPLRHPAPQPKLRVGPVDDPLEREADAVAENVTSMSVPTALQRKCSACGAAGETAPHIVHDILQEPGSPLDSHARAVFEPRFRQDFSDVRVHTGPRAEESARAVNALAYTVGSHLVFAGGQYKPHAANDSLLPHELAHVVQQRSGTGEWLQRMVPCPGRLHGPTPPGWQSYHGDSSVFHCGYRGILEDRIPTRDDPQNECFYDQSGGLVDEHHPFAGCRGTPNQYDSNQNPILHALIDSGGIVRAGAPAFLESRGHDVAEFLGGLEGAIKRLYGVP